MAGYVGGKRRLAGRIIERIDQVPHHLYAEPFVGMGGVFLRRHQAPPVEVINDISGDVATFFRVLQRHYVAFLEMLRFQITSRREFERLVATDPSTLTDLERAARFAYLQRTAFGGKVVGRTFGVDARSSGRFNVTRLGPLLEELHERLAGVIIERLPYADFLTRYDRKGALFYLDPPYWGSEGYYGPAFDRSDFARLAEVLGGLQGRFLLSINDVPSVREIFAAFEMEEVETSYSLNGAGRLPKRAGELIIAGGG
ncbi:DNA adenine methylase [Xanthobacter autotrophicus]|uniref:DNA adenine methylase n=1 Tax=Xanthobacter TaxID=279 RepID=UPI0024AB7D59|nr:DNA adenine methylase [Xanthobacter autotrophicus]MDI4664728.1 DNA adenine methylase [Xanthobacter autotrophicus]